MSPDDLDEALRALAHPQRRRILVDCQEQWRAAGDLADQSTLSLATVSEHLKVLRKTGLVVLRREGRFWWYRTEPRRLAEVVGELNILREE